MKNKPDHSKFELEALEPRILLSGDAADLLIPGASEAVQVVATSGTEQPSTLSEELSLGGEQLYSLVEGNDVLVNADGVWDSEGQQLAQELSGLMLAADSVVIMDGVEADNVQIDAASIYMGEVNWSGGSVLYSDELTITGKQAGNEDSSLTMGPRQKDATISLGSDAEGFSLDSDAMDFLSGSGIGNVTIGLEDGSHAFTIDGLNYMGNLTLRAPAEGGHFYITDKIQHSGGTLIYEGSGHTADVTFDIVTFGEDLTFEDSVQLVYDPSMSDNQYLDNTVYFDTTGGDTVSTGANILITADILGTTQGQGGTLYLNAGTEGDIIIQGNVGTTSPTNPLDGIVIVNARNVVFNGNVQLNTFTQLDGTGNTTFGNSLTDTTLAMGTGAFELVTENNVTFYSNVTSLQGNIDLTVNSASTVSGKIHFKETVTLTNGDLVIQEAKNVEFSKAVVITGTLTQTVGTETTIFREDVDVNSMSLNAENAISFEGEVRLALGDLTLTSNDVNFTGGAATIIGAADGNSVPQSHLLIRPVDESVSMDIGSAVGGTGVFKFTPTDIAALADGFSSLTFGYDAGATNNLRLGVANFKDPLSVYGGTLSVNATLTAKTSLLLDATVGGIIIDAAQVKVSNDQVGSVWQNSLLTLEAHNGNISFINGGSLLIDNNDDADLSQGSTIILTAVNGSILNAVGSSGFVTGRDLNAQAAGAITLLTEIKNFIGRSNTAGDITVVELDDLHVISAVTADGSITMTSGGNTTLDYVESENDLAGNDISMQVFNGSLDVGQVLGGIAGDVHLETEGALTGFSPQTNPHVVGNEVTLIAADGIGEGTVPLLMIGSQLTATNSTSGAVVIEQRVGRSDLVASIVNDAAGNSDHVYLAVDANLEVSTNGIHSASDAGMGVSSTGNVLVNGDFSGQGGLLSLVANGNLDISAGRSLTSGGGLVSVVSETGTFTQAADASIASGGGDIGLSVFLDATLGLLDARSLLTPADQNSWGNVVISSTGAVGDHTGSALMNVYANTFTISTQSGIGELDGTLEKGLEIDVAILAASTVTGDIALKDSNDLTVGTAASVDVIYLLADGTEDLQVSSPVLSGVVNGAGNILLSAGGQLTTLAVDAVSDAVGTAGSGTVAFVADSMSIEGIIRTAGGHLSLDSVNDITLLANGDLLTSGSGNIGVSSSAGSILADAGQSMFTGSGTIMLSALNAMELGTVETTGAVGLRTTNNNILAADGGTDTRTVVTGSTLAIDAFGINGPSLSTEKFRTNVDTLSLIGGTGPEFQIHNDGSMTLDTTSAVVNLYNTLLATAALTIAAQNDVDVSGNGNIGIVFDTGDGIVAAGRLVRTHGAGEIILNAGGVFTMGTGAKISNENGNIEITADGTASVSEVASIDGDITVISTTGSIIDSDPAETPVDFSTQGQLDLTASTGIGIESGERHTLNVLLGTLSAQTDTGGIYVTSTAGFATNGLISTDAAAPISVLSGGDLVVGPNGGGIAVDAVADLILLADGNLTQLADSTIDAAGDIRLSSGATMTLVSVATPADVAVTALVLTGLPATTATELTANGLFLDQVGTLGSVAQPMRFAIARLAGTVDGGTLVFSNNNDLILGQVTVETTPPTGTLPVAPYEQSGDRLGIDGIGEGILVDVTGGLTVDAGTGFALTVSEAIPVLWQTSGSQTWNDAFSLAGGNLTLRTGQDLTFADDGSSVSGNGNVSLEVGQDLTYNTGSGINTGSGSLMARVGDTLSIDGAIVSTASVGLIAGTDIISPVADTTVRVTAANLLLNATFNVSTSSSPLITDADQLTALSGAGGIYVDNQGDVNITNLGFSVPSLQFDGTVDVAFSGHQGGVRTVQAGVISVETTGTMTVQEVAAVIKAFPGTANAISIVADTVGPDGNDLNILFDIKTSGTEGNPPSTVYLAETSQLQVTLRKDVSTLQEILDAINANAEFAGTAVLGQGLMDGSQVFTIANNQNFTFFAEGGLREGVLVGVSGTFSGGLDAVSAVTQILLPGEAYNILFTALNPGEAANAFEVRLLDDGPGGHLTLGTDEAVVDWDEPNGKLNLYINYGVTTLGTLLTVIDDAQTNDSLPFSAELNGSFVPSDLDNVLGDEGVTLVSALSATADLRPAGSNNDIRITAVGGGGLYNGIFTEFVDDGSATPLASFNQSTNILTVKIRSGTTTANQVMTAINNEGTFSATLIQDSTGGGFNTGAGVIHANIFETHSGTVGVKAFANVILSGADNDLILTATEFSANENGIRIRIVPDASAPIGGATATYNTTDRILEVRVNSGFAIAENVVAAINATVPAVLTAAVVPSPNVGFIINLVEYPATAGGTGGPPEAIFTATGFNNDFRLFAEASVPSLENIQVFLIDDGTITDGSAAVAYDSGTKFLTLNVQSGVTTLNALLTVLNVDAGVPVFGTPLVGNDGSGVFNIPAQTFIGGADAVKAQVSTELPSGVELILEADVGGVSQNGIQVVYAIDDSLPADTALATLFEVDGVRLLQIQLHSATTTLDQIDIALTTAGLPFSVVGDVDSLTAGNLALRTALTQEGVLSLTAGNDIRLIGRVQSETGPVSISTVGTGDLTFDSETARIYAISKAEITLAGSFANLQSTENPLIKVFGDGLLRILAGENTVESELPVTLVSGGDITIGGTGGMSLNDQDLTVDAAGDITVSGPIDAGAGNTTFDAEGGITFTPTGSVSGTNLDLTSGLDFLQNGNFTGIGTGTITVTSTGGNITMGANAVTTSDSGNITYTADGNVGITRMVSISGNIDVVAGGAITDTHASNGTNLTTGGVTTLTAQTGIGSVGTGDLKTQVGDLQLRNLGASGDIVITEEAAGGNLTITELTQNGVSGWSILSVENGNLTFSGPVTHSGDGSLVLGVNGNLLAEDEINLGGGTLSAGVFGNVTFDKNVNTNGGDVGISSSGILSMDPTMTLDADGGNVLLQVTGNVLVSYVLSPDADVRIESTAASVLRAANGVSLNVTARTLQVEAALSIGTLVSEMAAMRTDVSRLNASALNGDLALLETDALLIGNSSVTVNFAQVDKSTVSGSWNESQLLTQNGAAVLQVGGALTIETITVSPTLSIDGNFRLSSGGVLTLNGDTVVTSGSAHLTSTLDLFLNGDLDVTGGTLLMQSGGVFTQDAASAITVTDDHAVLSSVGIMTLSRVDTGTGDLALSSDADLLIDSAAPALQLTSSGLRLESGGAIGSILNPVNLSADTLAALAVNGIHLDVTGNVDVNSVGVTVDMLSTLAVASDYVEANLADIESTNQGNILMEVSGLLELNDGDADAVAVTTTGAGKVFMGAGLLDAYADVRNVDGAMSLVIAGAAHWITTPESAPAAGDGLAAKLLSQTGDLHVVVGAALTMDDQTLFRTVNGNLRIQTSTNLLLGSVQAANGLVALDVGGSLLDNGNAHTDVIADELQILSGTGIGVLSPYDAVEINVNLLSAQVTTGSMVLSELSAVSVGEVSGSVGVIDIAGTQTATTVDPLYGLQSLGGGSVSMTSVGNLTVLSGGDPADTEYGISLINTGNLFLQTSGTSSVLTLNDSVMAGTGHLTLRGNGGIQFAADVSLETAGTGTLSVISGTAGITQVAGSELISVDGDIVLQAASTISLAGITTDARVAVSSTNGAILDNNAGALNINAFSARFYAGLNIATGTDPLEIDVAALSARTLNGAMYLTEADNLDIRSTQALSQVVQIDGTVISTPVAVQSGLKTGGVAGTIVVLTPAGRLNVLAGHTVVASQAGNILLESRDLLDVEAAITSGTGSITLNGGDINLDGGIKVTTTGAGEIFVGSIDRITTGAESRFVAGTGNVSLAATNDIVLGGITTQGRASVTSLAGDIRAAGSTTFNQEVVASQLALRAEFGGVGTLSPVLPVSAIRTRVGRVAGTVGSGGLNVVNEITVLVDEVSVAVKRVMADGSLQALPTVVLRDLTSVLNGSIVLRSTGGSVTLNEGGDLDGKAVSADGTGNVRIYASQNVIVNAAVESATGHVTLRAAGSLTVNSDVSTASTGTVYLRAEAGTLTMLGTATVRATGSNLLLQGSGDVTVGNLVANTAGVTSVNGKVINATGSTLNFSGGYLRLASKTDIGSSLNPLSITATSFSAVSNGGGVYVQASGDVAIGAGSVLVQEVQNDASILPVTAANQSGLTTTANNGPIVLVSTGGSITVSSVVSAQGSGNILLDANTQLTLDVDISSGTGNISLLGGTGIVLATGADVTTSGSGSVYMDAGSGTLVMSDPSTISAPGGSLRIVADGELILGELIGGSTSLISRLAGISKTAGSGINVSGGALRISAEGSIGSVALPIDLSIDTLAAVSATGDIFFIEANGVTVTGVTVTTARVGTDALTTPGTDAELSDLSTESNGDINLVTLAGSITLNDGGDEDFLAVEAHGSGTVRLVAAGNLAINRGIMSTTGDLTLLAGTNIAVGPGVVGVTTGDPGTILMSATTGAVSMNGLTQVTATGSTVRVSGSGDVTLGNLSGQDLSILSSAGAILNAVSSTRNVTGSTLRLESFSGIGTNTRFITTAVDTLSGLSLQGTMRISNLGDITVGTVGMTTQTITDAPLTGLATTTSGSIVLLSSGSLTVEDPVVSIENVRLSSGTDLILGDVQGVKVSLISAEDIVNPTGAASNVTAEALRIFAEGNIGSSTQSISTTVDLLSAGSNSGEIFIRSTGDMILGTVSVSAAGTTDVSTHGLYTGGGNIIATSDSKILDGGDALEDVRTSGLATLNAVSGIGKTGNAPLTLRVGSMDVTNSGNGSVYLDLTILTDVVGIDLQAGGYLYLTSAGALIQSGTIQLANGTATLNIAGGFTSSSAFTVNRDLRLRAESVTLNAGATFTAGTKDVLLRSESFLSMAAGSSVGATAGHIILQIATDATLGLVSAGRSIRTEIMGNLMGLSTDRLTHELIAPSLRLSVDGKIFPILTRTERLDVRAGEVEEIYEFDDLTAGRYGFDLVNPIFGDEFMLRMNNATLTSLKDAVTVLDDVVFVLVSDSEVTLGTAVITPEGDIRVDVDGFAVDPGLAGAVLQAAVGDVNLNSVTGVGTSGSNLVVVDAATFRGTAATGDYAVRFSTPVSIAPDGVTVSSGAGTIQLEVAAGDLTLEGKVTQNGTGTIQIDTPAGGINLNATTLTGAVLNGNGLVQLNLDTGVNFSAGNRLIIKAGSFGAQIRTGGLSIGFTQSTTLVDSGVRILGGSGNIDIQVISGNLLMQNNAFVRNNGLGNLLITVNGSFTMQATNILRVESGVLSVNTTGNFTMGQLFSLGSATSITSQTGDILRTSILNIITNSTHSVFTQVSIGHRIWLQADAEIVQANGSNYFRPEIGALIYIDQTFNI